MVPTRLLKTLQELNRADKLHITQVLNIAPIIRFDIKDSY
jgi:hypothetical protein